MYHLHNFSNLLPFWCFWTIFSHCPVQTKWDAVELNKPFRNGLSLGNIWLVPPNTDTMLSLILCSEQRDAHTQWHSTMHSWIWTRRCSNTVHQYIVESEHAFSSTYVWMLSLMLCFEQRDAHSLSITILQFNSIALCVSLTHSTMLLVESEGAFSSTYV